MRALIFALLVTTLYSCSTDSQGETEQKEVKKDVKKIESIDSTKVEEQTENKPLISDSLSQFNGNFFSISYPSNFVVRGVFNPLYDENADYAYFGTDEVLVVSENSDVAFFVYSPQWGGSPTNYLEPYPNEVLFSTKTEEEEVMPSNVHHWITFKDTTDAYFRSIYHKETENTNLVFGFQYRDEATKHLYQDAYTAFKKSLKQYAD